ncbi:MAG: polyprenyl synthetase family protein [archaeon]
MTKTNALTMHLDQFNKDLKRFLEGNLCGEKKFSASLFRATIDYAALRGKRLRPLLFIACYHALGGKRDVFPLGIAIELLHTSSLIHDDIMDEDDTRNNIPSVHRAAEDWIAANKKSLSGNGKGRLFRGQGARIGAGSAIICGNLMFTLGIQSVLSFKCNDCRTTELVKLYTEAYRNLNEGQLFDVSSEMLDEFSARDYWQMVEKKTAVLFTLAYDMAAAVTGRSLSRLGSTVRDLGLAFQLVDDLLDLDPDKEKGRVSGRALPLKKRTLLRLYTEEKAGKLPDRADAIRKVMIAEGSVERVAGEAEALIRKAMDSLRRSGIKSQLQEPFEEWAGLLQGKIEKSRSL